MISSLHSALKSKMSHGVSIKLPNGKTKIVPKAGLKKEDTSKWTKPGEYKELKGGEYQRKFGRAENE